jgi:hypothetical protein
MSYQKILLFILCLFIFISSPGLVAGQSNHPQDQGVAANAAQAKIMEDALAPYIAKARETLPEAKKKIPRGPSQE